MYGRLYRQRRRLVLSIFAGAIAGLAAGIPFFPLSILVGAVVSLALTTLVLMIAPYLRWEVLKATFLIAVLGLIARTGSPLDHPIFLGAAFLTGMFFLPSQPAWLDFLRVPGVSCNQASQRIEMTATELWERLFPRVRETHWDPALAGITPGHTPDNFFMVYAGRGYHADLRVPVHVFDVDEGHHFKMRDLSHPSVQDGGPVAVSSHVIDKDGDGAVITMLEGTWRSGIWTWFANWLDDHLAAHLDRISAVLEEREDWSVIGSHLRQSDR